MSIPHVSDDHYARYIVGSGITDAVAAARGYRTLRTRAEMLAYRFAQSQWTGPCLLIPGYDPIGRNGRYQIRHDTPRVDKKSGKEIRYDTPPARKGEPKPEPCPIICHPAIIDAVGDVSVPLWITEGVRKADAAISRGLCCVAILGIAMWHSRDWRNIPHAGRTIYLCFDSDVKHNNDVARQLWLLGNHLKKGNADVRYVVLGE